MTNLIVRCINTAGTAYLTQGKEYAVLQETIMDYRLFNDNGEHSSYSKGLFNKVNLPRQFHEQIIAWANGATIQSRRKSPNFSSWQDNDTPSWLKDWEYRVKPANPNAGAIAELETVIADLYDSVSKAETKLKQLK